MIHFLLHSRTHKYLKLVRVCEGGQSSTPNVKNIVYSFMIRHDTDRTRSVIDTWLTQTHWRHCTRVKAFGHRCTYPSSAVVVVLVCSISVTVTSPSFDSLRFEDFFTFLVLRSVVVYWTCTSTSAIAGVSIFRILSVTGRGRDPNSNGEHRWPNRRNYSRMFSDARSRRWGEFGI